MKKAIVTGATGFLGNWLIKELISRDVNVIAVVRNNESKGRVLLQFKKIKCVICPLDEINLLPSIINDDEIDVFYHLAWSGTSGIDRSDINLQLKNINGTCNAVKAATEIKCKKFVNAGSIMEYEAMKYISTDQTTPGLGNIYSTSKLTADFMAKTLAVSLGITYINAIISNIYGEGEKSARFINTTIRKFLDNEKVKFTHGEQLYDFIYASDAARAFYLIGEGGVAYTNYYVGNPNPNTLKDFIIKIKDIINPNLELNFGEIPFQGALLKYNEFDTNKLYKEFGFEIEVMFEHGIEKTVQWIKKNS